MYLRGNIGEGLYSSNQQRTVYLAVRLPTIIGGGLNSTIRKKHLANA